MSRIKRKWKKRAPPPLSWDEQKAQLEAKVAQLERRVKIRDQELVKEYGRRERQQARVIKMQRMLKSAGPVSEFLQSGAIDIFAQVFADMMRQATDNRVTEALMQIGPHTISDMRIGGDIDEEKQPPALWLTLPELEIRIRVDERIWPAGRLTREEAERLLGKPVALIEQKKA